MALYQRGSVWWYVFKLRGKEYRGSTLQSNRNRAKIVESKVRADAADALFGIGPAKLAPIFKDYIDKTFLPFVRTHHVPSTVTFYEKQVARLLEYLPLAEARLTAIDVDLINSYIVGRLQAKKKTRGTGNVGLATVNRELSTLRKALRYARDEKKIPLDLPKIRRIKGEKERTFVVDGDLEKAYLAAAPYPLKHAVILMCDLGLRPAEVVNLRKDSAHCATTENIWVRESKTSAGVRAVPQTIRSQGIMAELTELWPDSSWVFPGLKRGSHLTVAALEHLHRRLIVEKKWPAEFVLYSWRHTFGTRLAESGATRDAIKQLMGHTRLSTSEKYIHSSEEHVTLAMKRKEALDRLIRGEVLTESENGVNTET